MYGINEQYIESELVTTVTTDTADGALALESARAEIRRLTEQSDALREDGASMQRQRDLLREDLQTANTFLNDVANHESWCGDYEQHMSDLNDLLHSGFRFVGREKWYEVEVTLTSSFDKTIRVRATSSRQARSMVDEMDTGEVYQEVGLSSVYRDSTTDNIKIGDVGDED